MEKNYYLIVTAGGTGTRMGASVPKQFLEMGGKPILRITLEKFMEAVPGVHILTVLPETHIAAWREYCQKTSFACPQRLVKGGFTRFHSVKNALEFVPEDAIVAVHDGVRPLISVAKIRELFAAAQRLIVDEIDDFFAVYAQKLVAALQPELRSDAAFLNRFYPVLHIR